MRDTLTARDLMQQPFVGVSESDTVSDAAAVMAAEESDAIVVLRGNEPIGQLTVHDVLAGTLENDPETTTIDELGPRTVETVDASDSAAATHDRLIAERSRAIVVCEDDRPAGLITERDLALAANGYQVDSAAPAGERLATTPDADRSATTPDADRPIEQADRIQSVCEVCGALSASLRDVNGQLRCSNCIDL